MGRSHEACASVLVSFQVGHPRKWNNSPVPPGHGGDVGVRLLQVVPPWWLLTCCCGRMPSASSHDHANPSRRGRSRMELGSLVSKARLGSARPGSARPMAGCSRVPMGTQASWGPQRRAAPEARWGGPRHSCSQRRLTPLLPPRSAPRSLEQQPRSRGVGGAAAEPVPAPRPLTLPEAGAGECRIPTADPTSLAWREVRFLHSIFLLRRGRGDAKRSALVWALQPYIADEGSTGTRNSSPSACAHIQHREPEERAVPAGRAAGLGVVTVGGMAGC
ncbi:uncharacterized protein LOC118452105 isoform X2 [Egretta garzetta]|uniref:uncharacterized protein LOC118452105 isoform X2 n=1 Tax=Egretta garzetta TaxID=188379 RepID=UPI00163C3191|nr:uncharacterized protein LOC118452105 isoform X2 [Egretta garzetta]